MKKIITFFTFIISLQSIISQTPTINLVAHYKFDNNANDSSGYGNDGTVHGATLTVDRFGNLDKAYSFNGTSDYIEVPDHISLRPQQITLSAWVKTTDNDGFFIGKTNYSNASNEQYALSISPSLALHSSVKQNSNCIAGNGWHTVNTNDIINDNNWHNVVSTFDGTSIKIYIDGVLKNTNSNVPQTVIDNCAGGTLNFGRWWISYPSMFLLGELDDIRIYNAALTQEQVTNLFNEESLSTSEVNGILDNIKIYPNPTTGFVTIQLEHNETIHKIEIIDMLGKIVYSQNSSSNTIDLCTLHSGSYFIKTFANEKVFLKKIIKQ